MSRLLSKSMDFVQISFVKVRKIGKQNTYELFAGFVKNVCFTKIVAQYQDWFFYTRLDLN